MYYSEAGEWHKAGDAQAQYAAIVKDRDAVPRAMDYYLRAHAPARAIAVATRAAGWEQRADIRFLMGKAYSTDGKPDPAAAEYRSAIRLNPYEESYHFEFANELLRQQKFEPAIQVLTECQA